MTESAWTQTQIRRFRELRVDPDSHPADGLSPQGRNELFQEIEKKQVKAERKRLGRLLNTGLKSKAQELRERIEETLFENGFTGVTTPTITTRQALEKMDIGQDHPLVKQVFWLNDRQCLRPMLAPNLYSLMQDFARLNQRPVRFFEIGSCFRKESSGALHSNEFTMLNLVEMGLEKNDRESRLTELAGIVMAAAGIDAYAFEKEDSQVYGTTIDVVAGKERIEVASGAMGPHPLDSAWGIIDTWVGMGFGMERLLMVSEGDTSIGRWSKNLSYIDGICLNL